MRYIIDTCFWIALYSPEKEPEQSVEAEIISELIETSTIYIPYPTLYEFLNSKFSRKGLVFNFEKLLSRPNFIKVYDEKYREKSMSDFFEKAIKYKNDVSLVDEIIKGMIEDKKLKIDYLVSFDEGLKNFALSRGLKTN